MDGWCVCVCVCVCVCGAHAHACDNRPINSVCVCYVGGKVTICLLHGHTQARPTMPCMDYTSQMPCI